MTEPDGQGVPVVETVRSATPLGETYPSRLAIVPMRWWHIEAVSALEQQLFSEDPWTVGQFWGELARVPATRWFGVVTSGDDIVGYGGIFFVAPDADIQTIAVAPGAHGRGIGRGLLAELERQAVLRNATRMTLEVRADNVAAQALYTSSGYDRISIRKRYYGSVDALILQKKLGQAATGHLLNKPLGGAL